MQSNKNNLCLIIVINGNNRHASLNKGKVSPISIQEKLICARKLIYIGEYNFKNEKIVIF